MVQNNPINFYKEAHIDDSALYLDPIFWLYSVILGPLIEESSSRGSMTPFLAEQFEGAISKQHAKTWAITFDSVQFMLEHPKVFLFRFLMGLGFNELTELTDGRLMAAVSAHAINNFFSYNIRLFGASNTTILMAFLVCYITALIRYEDTKKFTTSISQRYFPINLLEMAQDAKIILFHIKNAMLSWEHVDKMAIDDATCNGDLESGSITNKKTV